MSVAALMAATRSSAAPPPAIPEIIVGGSNNQPRLTIWQTPNNVPAAPTNPIINGQNTSGPAAMNKNGTVVINTFGVTPFILANRVDSNGLGTAYSNPATLPPYSQSACFNPSGTVVASGTGFTPSLSAWKWDDITGWGTKYANPSGIVAASNGFCVSFNPAGTVIMLGQSATPFIQAWAWNDTTGFGARYSNPSVLTGLSVQAISWHPSGSHIIVACNGGLFSYPWSDVTGFGARSASASSANNSQCMFHPSGSAILLGGPGATGVGLRAIRWSSSSFSTFYTDPTISTLSGWQTPVFNPAGTKIVSSSSGTLQRIWDFDIGAGFGSTTNLAAGTLTNTSIFQWSGP